MRLLCFIRQSAGFRRQRGPEIGFLAAITITEYVTGQRYIPANGGSRPNLPEAGLSYPKTHSPAAPTRLVSQQLRPNGPLHPVPHTD
ncbi:hypothetical protein V494_06979 [Pseudogymnoascus sp. VKM F-4513 (FW-928)]|nr:hypothetical protein V494_06979 [Pseudogymnoascus sp. VKM F-4513 (FW-928)]